MRLLWSCILAMVVLATANPTPLGTIDNFQDPLSLDTPDDQDEVGTGANANPQGRSDVGSSFVPPADSSSSSSEEGSDAASVPAGGSVPPGTAGPAGSPVVGGEAAGANAAGAGGVQGGGAQGGGGANDDDDSGEKPPGGSLKVADPEYLSKIQAVPNSNTHKSNAGTSAGIAIGVLGLVSMATVGIIFAIRKKKDGFLRFYSQANSEL